MEDDQREIIGLITAIFALAGIVCLLITLFTILPQGTFSTPKMTVTENGKPCPTIAHNEWQCP